MDFLRKYSVIVLLAVWVALSFFVRLPWQPQSVDDAAPAFHRVLLLTDGQDKARSRAYEAVLLDSVDLLRLPPDLTLYLAKNDSLFRSCKAGDVLLLYTQLADGRGYVRAGEGTRLMHRTAREISLHQGKIRLLARRTRTRLEQLLERLHTGETTAQSPPRLSEETALIQSLVLGDRSALARNQREAFQDAGAMHILAVSGLHVGIILWIITFVVTLGGWWKVDRIGRHTPRGRRRLLVQRLLTLLGIWSYAFLSGLSTSVLRSAIMFSCLPVTGPREKSGTRFNRPALAALIILVINPLALRSAGFLLSFSAVVALMYYLPRWQHALLMLRRLCFGYMLDGRLKRKGVWTTVWPYVRDLVLASLAAQIGTLPWTLCFFGQSANWFLLTNLLVIPCAMLLAVATILTLTAGGLFGVCSFSTQLMHLTDGIAGVMNRYVAWVQHLPGATSFFTFTPALTALLITFILFLTLAARCLTEKRKRGYLYLLFATLTAIAIILLYARTIGA